MPSNCSKAWVCANISRRSAQMASVPWWSGFAPTPAPHSLRRLSGAARLPAFYLQALCPIVISQFGNRTETQRAFRQLCFDRPIRKEPLTTPALRTDAPAAALAGLLEGAAAALGVSALSCEWSGVTRCSGRSEPEPPRRHAMDAGLSATAHSGLARLGVRLSSDAANSPTGGAHVGCTTDVTRACDRRGRESRRKCRNTA